MRITLKKQKLGWNTCEQLIRTLAVVRLESLLITQKDLKDP